MEIHEDKKVGQTVYTVSTEIVVTKDKPETVFIVISGTGLDITDLLNKGWLHTQVKSVSDKMFKRAIKLKAKAARTEHLELHLKAKKA